MPRCAAPRPRYGRPSVTEIAAAIPAEHEAPTEGGPGVKYLIPRACAVTDKIMVEEVFTLIERRTLRTGEGVTTCGVK